MGHANVKNLSEFFVRQIRARGGISLREAIRGAVAHGLTLNASEGPYDDAGMIGMGLEVVAAWMYEDQGIIEPCHPLMPSQKAALDAWHDGTILDRPELHRALDTISWRLTREWRGRSDIPLLEYFEN